MECLFKMGITWSMVHYPNDTRLKVSSATLSPLYFLLPTPHQLSWYAFQKCNLHIQIHMHMSIPYKHISTYSFHTFFPVLFTVLYRPFFSLIMVSLIINKHFINFNLWSRVGLATQIVIKLLIETLHIHRKQKS